MSTHQKFSRRQGHHSAVTTLSFGYCHHLRFGSFLLNSAPGRCSKLNERANSTLSDLWLQFSPSAPRLHLISYRHIYHSSACKQAGSSQILVHGQI
ncbi:hypothetical protein WN944_023611 [Citrus x changshan-huyou]|uniref:Uncharacterized protein n=1 Tax=Citrus x changshan-huyou TaxID=2935761 RepID=A0AAP0R1C0_9ROSI